MISLISWLFILPNALAKDALAKDPIGSLHVMCGDVIIYQTPQAMKVDTMTDRQTPVKDGVYKGRLGWCIYKIVNGYPEEIDAEE